MIDSNSIYQFFLSIGIKKVLAIEVVQRKDGEGRAISVNGVILLKHKSETTIADRVTTDNFHDLSEWYDQIIDKEGIPVLLLVNSDKILHRKSTKEANEMDIFGDILNSSNREEFYFQKYALGDNELFYSLSRKALINGIVQQLGVISTAIVNVSVGFYPVFTTYRCTFAPDKDDHYNVNFENYHFSIKDNNVLAYNINITKGVGTGHDLNLYFGKEKVSKNHFLCYSLAICYLLGPLSATHIDYQEAKRNRDVFFFNAASKPIVFGTLISLFFCLMISSALFTFYNNKLQKLQVDISTFKNEWERTRRNQQKITEQQHFLSVHGLFLNSNISYYSDQVTASLPDYIYLTKLNIHPARKNDFEDLNFDTNTLIVEGNCYSSSDLNEWVDVVRKFAWVKQVIIDEYKQADSDELGSFRIEILKQLT